MESLIEYLRGSVQYVASLPTPVLVCTAIVLILLHYWPVWSRHRYPPGPIPLPFIGDTLMLIQHWDNIGKYMYDNFGEVFTLQWDCPTVVLNSPRAIQEGFVKNAHALSSRPSITPMSALGHPEALGMMDSVDGIWQPLRRHMLTVFREQGVGKQGMEEVILNEIQYYIDALEKTNQQPIDVHDQIMLSVSNVISHIVFGERFEYGAEQLSNLQFLDLLENFFTMMYVPFMKWLPWDPLGYHASQRQALSGLKLCQAKIEEHKESLDPENPRDFIDSFLIEMQKAGDDTKVFTNENLLGTVMQIFVGGADTSSLSLYWAFLFLMVNPSVQDKIHQEIKDVIGERSPKYTDRQNMHYTMSAITEILRTNITVCSLRHFATKDTVVCGHTIPKGTIVMANFWSTTHNDAFFIDSDNFKADRFLDSEGKFSKPDTKEFLPFGSGRRACPGEQLARAEVFLFLVATLQKFRIECGQETTPSTVGKVKFLQEPQRYKIKLIARH